MRRLQIVFGLVAALLATAAVAGPWAASLNGLSFDTLIWLRLAVLGPRFERTTSTAIVVAIDEETYRRAPFETTPKAMWTRDLAPVVDAIADAGATVIGFDVILPTTVAGEIRGYDTPFLQSLHRHARDGRLLLSKTQHSLKPILPAPGQRFAVGHGANIRSVNLFTERDGIIRGVPPGFVAENGTPETSFAAELARRAQPDRLTFDADGRLLRDGSAIPGTVDNSLLVDFDDTQAGIPTFSLADLYACAQNGDSDYFRRHFAGHVVIVGSVLDVEDRKLTSLRFATAPDTAAYAERCVHPPMAGLLEAGVARDSLPGVYVHAFAVNNLIRGNLLGRPDRAETVAIIFALALLAAAAATLLPTALFVVLLPLVTFVWAAAAMVALDHSLALPLFEPPLAAALAFALTTGYRTTVTDRDKRLLRQMFGYYLAPAVIDRMVDGGETPRLGGETRKLTIYFSDLEGFTALSEGLAPDTLVNLLNAYLTAMTEVIEAQGGFVDKYIGDAVVAVFGAPHRDPDHAAHAVAAALAGQHALAALNARHAGTDWPLLRQRIGLNTGSVVVGNIGSQRRFNYTVTGDAVNLAARLEGASKLYGTGILVSAATAAQAAAVTTFREIDAVRVVGRDAAVTLLEPDPPKTVDLAGYATALAAYRAGDFVAAAEGWAAQAEDDPAAAAMAARARAFAANPPTDWDGVFDLDSK